MSETAHLGDPVGYVTTEDGRYHSLSPVPDFARIDTREAAAKNWADWVTRMDGLEHQVARAFELLPQRQAEMLEQGSRVEPCLEAWMQAALVAWQSNRQGEAPIGRPVS